MKLVIHAGTHKTATTAFQDLCHANRALLARHGIRYPEWEKRRNHGFLARSLQRGEAAQVARLFAAETRRAGPGETLLLSGEGLERCFVDLALAAEIERVARGAGIGRVEWVVVRRDPFDYFESLYGELSKQYLAMNYVEMAETILAHGFLSAACKYYDYIFVFDPRFFAAFPERAGAPLHVLDFEDFATPYPGHALFAGPLAAPGLAADLAALAPGPVNARFAPAEVEFRHLCNFLGMPPVPQTHAAERAAFDALTRRRLVQIERERPRLGRAFRKRFRSPRWRWS